MSLRQAVAVVLAVLVLLPMAGAIAYTVDTEDEWDDGTLDGVTVRNGSLELDAPLESLGFETEVSLEYWDIHRGDAFVPETGFTGNDAMAMNGSVPVPGVGNVTHMNYTIPAGFEFESGATFEAWMRHNVSGDDRHRVTYRLEGPNGTAAAWVDEDMEAVRCVTDKEEQTIASNATDDWYHVAFTLYPGSGIVNCEVRNDTDRIIGSVNLSVTIDFDEIVLRAVGDAEPWGWFDDVTIPRYKAEGTYTSPSLGNNNIQDWKELDADVANVTQQTNVTAVFRSIDSSGTIVGQQIITLRNGTRTYTLTAPNSVDARMLINGTTSDPALTWSVASYIVRSNNTTIAAPAIDNAAVSPQTADPGEALNFSAELTDDDGDQNTVDLWHRPPDGDWRRLNRTTVTPVTADTLVTFQNSFTSNASGTNQFLFNTTDAHGLISETETRTFNITSPDDTTSSSSGGGEDEETKQSGGGGALPGGGGQNTTTNRTNVTGGDGNDTTQDTENDTTKPREPSTPGGTDDGGSNLLLVLLVLVAGIAAMAGYYLYTA